MEDSMSITKDIGEYYIYHKDNKNLKVLSNQKLVKMPEIWVRGLVMQWEGFKHPKHPRYS